MPRPPRFSYARAVHHVTLRCNNREFLFSETSFGLFFDLLQQARGKFPLELYDYCLMTNHVHLLFKVGRDDTLSKAMHWLDSTFSKRFNRMRGRKGHLWEARFRSAIIEQSTYFFRCMAYIDLNPVRAGMVADPIDYRWCGHRALKAQDTDTLDFHPLYLEAGRDAASRYRFYVGVLDEEAARGPVSLATEYFVGTRRFLARMARRYRLDSLGVSFTRREIGSGVMCLGPKRGRVRRSL